MAEGLASPKHASLDDANVGTMGIEAGRNSFNIV